MEDRSFITGEFYHIYNRGTEKRDVFIDRRDQLRFLETVTYYIKSPQIQKLSDKKKYKVILNPQADQVELVAIYCYCLMPNHFHFIIQQLTDGGITRFMRIVLNSYTKYFNTKYERVGALFQGVFKAKLIDNDEYLLQSSKYIHRNPFPPERWEDKLEPLSSYYYYLTGESHSFCDTERISSYFSDRNPTLTYKSFVEDFGMLDDPALFTILIDEE